MTVSNDIREESFIGDGIQVAYPFTIQSNDPLWVQGFVDDVLMSGSVVLNVDQSQNPGGTFTFDIAPVDMGTVLIKRTVPLLQELNLPDYSAFPAQSVEATLDQLVMTSSQLVSKDEGADVNWGNILGDIDDQADLVATYAKLIGAVLTNATVNGVIPESTGDGLQALFNDGLYKTPAGGGNVSGAGVSVVGNITAINNTSTTSIADSGVAVADIELLSNKGIPNGYAPLDGSGFVPLANLPVEVQGGIRIIGFWDANTNTPDLNAISLNQGEAYQVSVSGGTLINGEENWKVKDLVVWSDSLAGNWFKLDNTDDVISVAGKTGAVVLNKNDVGLDQVDNTSDADKPVSTAQQIALDAKYDKTGGPISGSVSIDATGGTDAPLNITSGATPTTNLGVGSFTVGSDGTLYSYDSGRASFLSVAPEVLQFGRNGAIGNEAPRFGGDARNVASGSIRDYARRVVGFYLKSTISTTQNFDVYINGVSAGTITLTASDNIQNSALNISVAAGQHLNVFAQAAGTEAEDVYIEVITKRVL